MLFPGVFLEENLSVFVCLLRIMEGNWEEQRMDHWRKAKTGGTQTESAVGRSSGLYLRSQSCMQSRTKYRFGEEELLQVLELCALGFNNPKYAFTVVKKLRKRFYIEVDGWHRKIADRRPAWSPVEWQTYTKELYQDTPKTILGHWSK